MVNTQNVVHDAPFYDKKDPEDNNHGSDELENETHAMLTDGAVAAGAFSLPVWIPYVEGWVGLFISICTAILVVGRLIRLFLSFKNWLKKKSSDGRNQLSS